MKIFCIGDSLTFGNVGYSYIHFLNLNRNPHYEYINKWKNGDTVRGCYDRLKKIVDKSQYNSKIYVLGIGTNDIFLPYLKFVSMFWFLQMSLRCKIKKCIENDDIFYQEYNKILNFLCTKKKQVITLGMPFINLKNFPHENLIKRNRLIEELAKKYNYPFIDIYKLQKAKIDADHCVYTWKYRYLIRVIDAVIMTLFPFTKDYFAKIRNLTTSVDGVHFNSKSTKILAMEIEKKIISKIN